MAEELTILTRGQEELYKYLLWGTQKVQEKIQILDRMLEVYDGPDDKKFLGMIRLAAQETGQTPGYDFLVENHFPYHLEVLEGEKTLTTPEAHLTLVSETELKQRKKAASDLMAVQRHLLECKDPDECKQGKCPHLPKQDPMITLENVSLKMRGGGVDSKPLRFRDIYEDRKTRSLGAQTCIGPFDEKILGLEPGTLCVVAGWTGSYKTTFAMNLAHQNAVKNGYNTVFITSEVPKEILYLYLLCRHSFEEKFADHGPVHRLSTQKATLTPAEEKFLDEVVEPDLLNNPDYGKILILDESDFRTFDRAGIKARLLSIDWDIDILVYDYIQLVKYMDDAREVVRLLQVNPVNYYVRVFADLAMHLYGGRHKLLSLVLSQINREGWKKAVDEGGQYDITCLAEANELERSAYYCIALFSNQDLKESGELSAQLLKHRGGEVQEEPVLTPLDSRYLAIGSGIEGFGETESSDLSGLLTGGNADDLFGGMS